MLKALLHSLDYKETTLMGSAPSHIVRHLTTTNSSYNNHVRGLFPKVSPQNVHLIAISLNVEFVLMTSNYVLRYFDF